MENTTDANLSDVEQTLAWADGEYQFKMDWKALVRVQADCDVGPMALLQDMVQGRWKVQQIASIIRHALIGGGLDQNKAQKLVAAYVEGLPPESSLHMATGLLYMGLYGFDAKKAAKLAEDDHREKLDELHAVHRQNQEV